MPRDQKKVDSLNDSIDSAQALGKSFSGMDKQDDFYQGDAKSEDFMEYDDNKYPYKKSTNENLDKFLRTIEQGIVNQCKVDTRIRYFKQIINQISYIKQNHGRTSDNDILCDWIMKMDLINKFINDDTHPEILRKMPIILSFMYENSILDQKWLQQFATNALSAHQELLKVFLQCLNFMKIADLSNIFSHLRELSHIQSLNFPKILMTILSVPNFCEQPKNKRQRSSDEPPNSLQIEKSLQRQENQSNQLFTRLLQNYPQTEMDPEENLKEIRNQLSKDIFMFLIQHRELSQEIYLPILNKLISVKYHVLEELAIKQIIGLLKSQKTSYLSLSEFFIKAYMAKYPEEGKEQNQQKPSFLEKLANQGIYQSTISVLAKNRFEYGIIEKSLTLLFLLGKYYKPHEKSVILFIWNILGVCSTTQKQRQQFFCFIKDSLKYESTFTEEALLFIFYEVILSIHHMWFSPKVYECFQLIFKRLNQDLKLVIFDCNIQKYQIVDPQLIGLNKFWEIYFGSQEPSVIKRSRQFLCEATSYLENCGYRDRQSFFICYWHEILNTLNQLKIQENYDKFNKTFDIIDKLVLLEAKISKKKKQAIRQSDQLQLYVKNQNSQASSFKHFMIKISQNASLRQLYESICKKISKSQPINLNLSGMTLPEDDMTLNQMNIADGNTIIVTEREKQEDQTLKNIVEQERQQINNNIQHLRQIFSHHQEQFLGYVSKKYRANPIETIIEYLFNDEISANLLADFQQNQSKAKQEKSKENPQPVNVGEIPENQEAIKFSTIIISDKSHIETLLECGAQYNYQRVWETIEQLPICPDAVQQIERLMQNYQWEQIMRSDNKMLQLYNLHLIKHCLKSSNQRQTKKEQTLKYVREGYIYIFDLLQSEVDKESKEKTITMKLSAELILFEIQINLKFKMLRQYPKINFVTSKLKIRNNLYSDFLASVERKYWGCSPQQSGSDSSIDDQLSIPASFKESNDRIKQKILRFMIRSPKNSEQVQASFSLIAEIFFYALVNNPTNLMFELTQTEIKNLYDLHGYLAEYMILFSLSQMVLTGKQEAARYFDATLKKLVNLIFDNLQPGNHLIAVFDTVSNLFQDKLAKEISEKFMDDAIQVIIDDSEKIGSEQLACLLQLLTQTATMKLSSTKISDTSSIKGLVIWLLKSYLFEIQNPHKYVKNTLIREYGYHFLTSILEVESEDRQLQNYIIEHLQSMKVESIKNYDMNIELKENKFIGLTNLGTTCYVNSLIQQIYHTKFSQLMIAHEPQRQNNSQEDIETTNKRMNQLKLIFMDLYSSYKNEVNPETFLNCIKFYGEKIMFHQQQDVSEFLFCLFGYLEAGGYKKEVQDVFGGTVYNLITLIENNKCIRENEEHYNSLAIDIKNKKNLQEAFTYYIKPQLLTGQNMFEIEPGQKIKAFKRIYFQDFPNIFIINLKRFQYNYETCTRSKLNDYFQFPLQMDMHQFSGEYLKNRQKCSNSKYKLVGVLVHVGSAQSGHYYSIIKVDDKWYEFNDNIVRQFNIENLKSECFGCSQNKKTKSAYMIFYEKISSDYHGVHLKNIDENNPIKQMVIKQNSKFLKHQLMNDELFKNFLKNIKQIAPNSTIQNILNKINNSRSFNSQIQPIDVDQPPVQKKKDQKRLKDMSEIEEQMKDFESSALIDQILD